MVSLARTFAILVVFFVWLAKPALAQFSFPEYDNIYVNDDANIIDFEVENRLKAYLIEAEANGTQITVVTIDQLSSFNAGPLLCLITGESVMRVKTMVSWCWWLALIEKCGSKLVLVILPYGMAR